MRIVSLLPSATEIVCELGIADQLVGVSHECDYPDLVRKLPKVTRSKIPENLSSLEIDQTVRDQIEQQKSLFALSTEILERLKPDLIITQSLCDVCAVAESDVARAIANLSPKPQVLNLSPMSLNGVFDSILAVGQATGHRGQAIQLVDQLKERVERIRTKHRQSSTGPCRAILLEWLDPLFSAGHWNPELIELAGGIECIGRKESKSTQITFNELHAADSDVLLIACCGYPIRQSLDDLNKLIARDDFKQLRAVINNRVYVADGNAYFNRPGPRLVDSLEILAHCLHPDLYPLPMNLQSDLIRIEPL